MIDFETLDFFTIITNAHAEPRATLRSQAELQCFQDLEDSDTVLNALDNIRWSSIYNRNVTLRLTRRESNPDQLRKI